MNTTMQGRRGPALPGTYVETRHWCARDVAGRLGRPAIRGSHSKIEADNESAAC